MKQLRFFLACMACICSFGVAAQWQWLDKDGHKVFSDRPPPSDIPDKSILKQPAGQKGRATDDPALASAGAASAPRPAASGIKISGKDPALEAKKKEAEDQEAAKKKAEEDRQKQAKAENCERARKAKASLDSGVRMKTTNDKGEQEYMSDSARAAESQRISDLLKDCS